MIFYFISTWENLLRILSLLAFTLLAGCGGGSSESTNESLKISLNPFTPSSVAGLNLWLDSSDRNTLFTDNNCVDGVTTEGDKIGCWMDKSGFNRDATSLNIINRPEYKTEIHPSKSLVEFDGLDDYFDDNYGYEARSIFIVFRSDSDLQNPNHLAQLWGNPSEFHIALDTRAGVNQQGFSFDGASDFHASYALDGENYSEFASNSNEINWYMDNFNLLSVNFENKEVLSRQIIGSLVPNFSVGTHQFGGQIAEILVYQEVLTISDQVKIQGYLACKWGLQGSLSPGHAYRSDCP